MLELADFRYMSGPKADMILEHAGVKKKRKRPKNEDYTATVAGGGGLVLEDADEWKKSKRRDLDLDAEDAPGELTRLFAANGSGWQGRRNIQEGDVGVVHRWSHRAASALPCQG
jgi:hypothetical protein